MIRVSGQTEGLSSTRFTITTGKSHSEVVQDCMQDGIDFGSEMSDDSDESQLGQAVIQDCDDEVVLDCLEVMGVVGQAVFVLFYQIYQLHWKKITATQ